VAGPRGRDLLPERGHTHYTPNLGTIELRVEVARYLHRRFGLEYDPESEVLITIGASEAIDSVLRVILEPGDGVLIPEPCFVAYQPCTVMAGGRAIPVPTRVEQQFQVQPEALAAADDGARALLINYPNNPTGATISREGMQRVVDYAVAHDQLVISDEVYAELTYGREHVSAAAMPGARDRTILVSGFSKAWP